MLKTYLDYRSPNCVMVVESLCHSVKRWPSFACRIGQINCHGQSSEMALEVFLFSYLCTFFAGALVPNQVVIQQRINE